MSVVQRPVETNFICKRPEETMATKRQWQEMAGDLGGDVKHMREFGGGQAAAASAAPGAIREQLTQLCRESRKLESELTEHEKNVFKQEQSYITQCSFGNVHEGVYGPRCPVERAQQCWCGHQ